MGQWDYGTMRPTNKPRVADTTPFTFHLSPFSLSSPNAPFARGSPSERSFVRSLWEENETMGLWDVAADK